MTDRQPVRSGTARSRAPRSRTCSSSATERSRSRSDMQRGRRDVLAVEVPRLVEPSIEGMNVGVGDRRCRSRTARPTGPSSTGTAPLVRRAARRAGAIRGARSWNSATHRHRLVRLVGVTRRHLLQHLLERTGTVRLVEAQPLLAVERPRPGGRRGSSPCRRGAGPERSTGRAVPSACTCVKASRVS